MVLIGSDAIGQSKISQHQYIAIVIGTDESINRIYNNIGLPEIHMRDLTPNQRRRVMETLDFGPHDLTALCLHLERQTIIDDLRINEKLNPKRKQKIAIHKHFDYLLLKEIKNLIEEFTLLHGQHVDDLTMQCDGDMLLTAQNWNMGTTMRGRAYELSDALAFCNQRRHHVDGCHELDLRDKLRTKMYQDLLK